MDKCKISINKNNGSINLKGLKDKKQFKQDDDVIIMLKSEYDDLINDNNKNQDVPDLHKFTEFIDSVHDDYHDLSIKYSQLEELNKSLKEHNSDLKKENNILKVNESERIEVLKENAVLHGMLENVESDLVYHKLLTRALLNRKLWERIRNSVPDVADNE